MSEYFKIGRLVATHGLLGDLVLQHALGKKTTLKGLEQLFIEELPGSFLPYFIDSARSKSEVEVYIHFEGIVNKEGARKLIPRDAWVTEQDFHRLAGKSAPISLLGFEMVQGGIVIGVIREVIEQPHQILCVVPLGKSEALIPLHENSLQKIDRRNKKVHVNLPDGLLEIYR